MVRMNPHSLKSSAQDRHGLANPPVSQAPESRCTTISYIFFFRRVKSVPNRALLVIAANALNSAWVEECEQAHTLLAAVHMEEATAFFKRLGRAIKRTARDHRNTGELGIQHFVKNDPISMQNY